MRVVHAVVSDAFAGVERYLLDVLPLLAERGVDVELVGGPTLLGEAGFPWRPAASLGELFRGLRKVPRADIVHAHMTDAELVCALARCAPALVCTRHFAAERGTGRSGVVVRRLLAGRFDAQYAISATVASATREPTVVLPLGVPNAAQALLVGRRALIANRLETEKDTATALLGWQAARLWEEGWTLDVVGDGAERAQLESRGITAVTFLGRADIRTLLSDYDLLIAAAPAEPLGLVVLEAMARGVPVVASRGGGHVESLGAAHPYLFQGVTDLAQVLARAANGTSAEVGLVERARQRTHFTLGLHADRLAGAYKSLLLLRNSLPPGHARPPGDE